MTKIVNGTAPQRNWKALFELLAAGAKLESNEKDSELVLVGPSSRLTVTIAELSDLSRKGLIRRQGQTISLTQSGENLAPLDFIGRVTVTRANNGSEFCVRNSEESPLEALRRRKDGHGNPFLDGRQFDAGEHLRADFTLGLISPRVSANWQAAVPSSHRSGSSGSMENLTLTAIAARKRFEAAIGSLDQDLSGVVVDFCCYLKGLEQIEAERRWPKRSAKFLLRAGLAMLARHYNPGPSAKRRSYKWGAEDFRPAIR